VIAPPRYHSLRGDRVATHPLQRQQADQIQFGKLLIFLVGAQGFEP
jgi:hypothetical protein